MIAAQYNARAIAKLKKGKAAAWRYIQSIPAEFQPGAISAVKLIIKRGEK